MVGWTLDDVRNLDCDEYDVLIDELNKEAQKK